ncbi:hypothetical protein CHU98_g4687 [Xylaria longipes]|nr:hypothetical protein CHU98_g4687 [Xylaria longipes]
MSYDRRALNVIRGEPLHPSIPNISPHIAVHDAMFRPSDTAMARLIWRDSRLHYNVSIAVEYVFGAAENQWLFHKAYLPTFVHISENFVNEFLVLET